MQWAEGGSLDDLIDIRMGHAAAGKLPHLHSSGPASSAEHNGHESESSSEPLDPTAAHSRTARIRAFRALQRAPPEQRDQLRREMAGLGMRATGPSDKDWKPIHLFSAEEVKCLFTDVVEGLAFLVHLQVTHHWRYTDLRFNDSMISQSYTLT